MNFQYILLMPLAVLGATGLGTDIVLAQDATGGQQQRELAIGFFLAGNILGDCKLALADRKIEGMHGGRAIRMRIIAGPLDASQFVQLVVTDTGKRRRKPGDLIHDFGRMVVMHRIAQRIGQRHGHFPVFHARHRRHHLAHPVNAALGVGEGAVLLKERGARQQHVGILGGFVQEDVLHNKTIQRAERSFHMLGIGIGLGNVLTLHIHGLEAAGDGGIKHVGNSQARLIVDGHVPGLLKPGSNGRIAHMLIARQLVGEGAHVTGTLNVVLATERIHANTFTANVAGGHGQVGNAHHHGRALAVLGDPEAVIDGAITRFAIGPRGLAHQLGGYAGDRLQRFRRVSLLSNERPPLFVLPGLTPAFDKGLIFQALGHNHMGQGIDHRHVGTRA